MPWWTTVVQLCVTFQNGVPMSTWRMAISYAIVRHLAMPFPQLPKKLLKASLPQDILPTTHYMPVRFSYVLNTKFENQYIYPGLFISAVAMYYRLRFSLSS